VIDILIQTTGKIPLLMQQGPDSGREKVIRGGIYHEMGESFRPGERDKISPDKASKKTGFRLAMSLN
jgi:hypothetical protein